MGVLIRKQSWKLPILEDPEYANIDLSISTVMVDYEASYLLLKNL